MLTDRHPEEARPQPPDCELIARAVAGSEADFRRLLERYRPLLWGVAWRLALDADDAWDIVQETAIRVWRALPHHQAGRPLGPWLRVIAVREALRWLRRHRSGPRVIPLESVEDTISADCEMESGPGRIAAQDERREVAEALARLSPQQRTAVSLRFHEELRVAEIAEIMECSEGSVKQHLFRAMNRLRELLGKNGKGARDPRNERDA